MSKETDVERAPHADTPTNCAATDSTAEYTESEERKAVAATAAGGNVNSVGMSGGSGDRRSSLARAATSTAMMVNGANAIEADGYTAASVSNNSGGCFNYPSTSTCDQTSSANTGTASDSVTPLSGESHPTSPGRLLDESTAGSTIPASATATATGMTASSPAYYPSRKTSGSTATAATRSATPQRQRGDDEDERQAAYCSNDASSCVAHSTPIQEPPNKQLHRDPTEEEEGEGMSPDSLSAALYHSTSASKTVTTSAGSGGSSVPVRTQSRARKVPMDKHIRRGSHAAGGIGGVGAADADRRAAVRRANTMILAESVNPACDACAPQAIDEEEVTSSCRLHTECWVDDCDGIVDLEEEAASDHDINHDRSSSSSSSSHSNEGIRGTIGQPHPRVASGASISYRSAGNEANRLEPSSYIHQKQHVFKPQAPPACGHSSCAGGGAPCHHKRVTTAAADSTSVPGMMDLPADPPGDGVSAANKGGSVHGSTDAYNGNNTNVTAATAAVSKAASLVDGRSPRSDAVPVGFSGEAPLLFESSAQPRLAIPLTEPLFASAGISRLITLLCARNQGAALPSSAFHSHCKPPMSVKSYMERIERYCNCSGEAMVCGAMLMLKYVIFSGHPVTIFNAHRLMITSMLLGIKMRDDIYYNNVYYARIGGLPSAEMNKLEVIFLDRLNWEMDVNPEEYAELRAILAKLNENVWERDGFLSKFARQHPEEVDAFNPDAPTERNFCTPIFAGNSGAAASVTHSPADLQKVKVEGAYWKFYWESVVEPWLADFHRRCLAHVQNQTLLEQKAWACEKSKWEEYRRRDEEDRLGSEGGGSASSRWMSPVSVTNIGTAFPAGCEHSGGGGGTTGAPDVDASGFHQQQPSRRSNSSSLVFPGGLGSTAAPTMGSSTRYANFVSYCAVAKANVKGSAGSSSTQQRHRSSSSGSGSRKTSAVGRHGTASRAPNYGLTASTAPGLAYVADNNTASTISSGLAPPYYPGGTSTIGYNAGSGVSGGFGISHRALESGSGGGQGNSSSQVAPPVTRASNNTNSNFNPQPRPTAVTNSALNVNAQPYQYVSRRHRRAADGTTATATAAAATSAAEARGGNITQGGGDRNNFSTVGSSLGPRTGSTASLASNGFAANTISSYNTTSIGNNAPHIRFTNWRSSEALAAAAAASASSSHNNTLSTAVQAAVDSSNGVPAHHHAYYNSFISSQQQQQQQSPTVQGNGVGGAGSDTLATRTAAVTTSSVAITSAMSVSGGSVAAAIKDGGGGRKRPKPDSFQDQK